MLKERQLKTMIEELDSQKEELQKLKKEHSSKQSGQSEIKEKISVLGSEIKTLSKDVDSLDREIVSITKKHNDLQREISHKENILKEDNEVREIDSLFQQQPKFWEQLQKRIEHHQQELNEGFEIFDAPIAPEKICKRFRELADESNSFSELAYALRSGKGAYETYMKDICKKQLDGQTIPPSAKRERISILDRCLMKPEVEREWA